ncbi:MAG TPA: hypothetical protein VGE01_05740 [Fimbriimonas sp.]
MLNVLALSLVGTVSVTFSHPPERLAALLPALGNEIGRPLKPDSLLEQEVVVLHVQQTDAETVLAKIAEAAGAEWVDQDDGTRVLTRTAEARRQMIIQASQERASRIRQSLLKNALASPFQPEEVSALRRKVENHNSNLSTWTAKEKGASLTALGHAAEKLLRLPALAATLPWEALAQTNERTVFSDKPNRMQSPLPSESLAWLADAYRAHAALYEAGRRYESVNREDPYAIRESDVFGSVSGPAVKTDIAASVQPNYVTLSLTMFDAKGRVLRFGTYRATPSPEAPKALTTVEGFLKPFRLEGTADRLTSRYAPSPEPLPVDLKARILDPVSFEPLADSMAKAFQTLGKDAGLNVVALLPDFPSAEAAVLPTKRPLNYRQFLTDLNLVTPMRYESEEGWLSAWPQDRELVRSTRVDRKLLGRYLRRVAEVGPLPFDELAEYAYALPAQNHLTAPILVRRLQSLLPLGRRNELADWQTLRLWGSLPAAVRRRLANGEATTVAALPESTRNLLIWLVSRTEWGTTNARLGDPDAEVTERLPNGLPLGAPVVAAMKTEPGLWSTQSRDVNVWTAVSRDSGLSESNDAGTYQPALLSTLEIQVRIDPISSFVGSVQNHLWIDRSRTPAKLLMLPRPFLEECTEGLTRSQWQSLPSGYVRKLQAAAGVR